MMSAAHSAFILIVATTIAMINISSTSMWHFPNGRCTSVGVPCRNYHNCTGICNCILYRDTTGVSKICMEPGYNPLHMIMY
uniref:Defensin n=1 Tax=Rhipicephalus zambeziensis TaxID=60191 RepID=A0A224Y368_9ACAR